MKSVAISGSPRASVGKKDAKALRKQGQVPCVLYGGKEQVSFAVDATAFKPLVYTPETLTVKLELGGNVHDAILQDLQLHPVTDAILHADFIELVPGKAVVMNLPVIAVGNSEGVKAGGKLVKKLRKVKVRGPIEKMPENLEINIEKLGIGDKILVRDLSIDGLEFLDGGHMTVIAVQTSRAVVEEPKAAAAAPAAAAKPAAGAAAAPAAAAAKAPAKK